MSNGRRFVEQRKVLLNTGRFVEQRACDERGWWLEATCANSKFWLRVPSSNYWGLNADTHTSVGRSDTDTSRNRLSWEKEHHANHLAHSNAHKEGTTAGRNPAPRKSLAFHTPGPCACQDRKCKSRAERMVLHKIESIVRYCSVQPTVLLVERSALLLQRMVPKQSHDKAAQNEWFYTKSNPLSIPADWLGRLPRVEGSVLEQSFRYSTRPRPD